MPQRSSTSLKISGIAWITLNLKNKSMGWGQWDHPNQRLKNQDFTLNHSFATKIIKTKARTQLEAASWGEITDPRALHPSSPSWLFWHFSSRSIQAVHFLRVQIFIILIMVRDQYMEAFTGPESIFTVPAAKHFWKTLFHLIVGADSSGAASERLMLHMFESSNSKQRILHWFLALVVFITPQQQYHVRTAAAKSGLQLLPTSSSRRAKSRGWVQPDVKCSFNRGPFAFSPLPYIFQELPGVCIELETVEFKGVDGWRHPGPALLKEVG